MSRKLTRAEQEQIDNMPDFTPIGTEKKPFREKFADFIADNRFFLIFGAVIIAIAALVFGLIAAQRDDVKIMLLSDDSLLSDKMCEQLQDYFMFYTPDVDRDASQTCRVVSGFYSEGGELSESRAEAAERFEKALKSGETQIFIADAESARYLAENGLAASFAALFGDESYVGNAIRVGDSKIFTSKQAYFDFAYDDGGYGTALADYYIMVNAGVLGGSESELAAAKGFVSNVLAELDGYRPEELVKATVNVQ